LQSGWRLNSVELAVGGVERLVHLIAVDGAGEDPLIVTDTRRHDIRLVIAVLTERCP